MTPPLVVTLDEAANALQVHPATVRRWIAGGLLRAVRLPSLGRRQPIRIPREELDRVLSEGAIRNDPPPDPDDADAIAAEVLG